MVEISLLQLCLRTIPESFCIILGSYMFVRKPINRKKIVITSLLYSAVIYLAVNLPISFGVHTIISIVGFIVISTMINKLAVMKVIPYTLIFTIAMIICEVINILLIKYVLNINPKTVFEDPLKKVLYGTPSLVFFIGITLLAYIFLYKHNKE